MCSSEILDNSIIEMRHENGPEHSGLSISVVFSILQ